MFIVKRSFEERIEKALQEDLLKGSNEKDLQKLSLEIQQQQLEQYKVFHFMK